MTTSRVIWFRTQTDAAPELPKIVRRGSYRTFPEHDRTDVQLSAPQRFLTSVLRAAPRPWTQAIRAFRGIRRTRDVVRSER